VRVGVFPWYVPPFSEYNVAQAAAIPYLDKDVNLVVSFATAAGKTVLAECCFAYHLKTSKDCRVAYVCPFRSLASEKYQAWRKETQLSKFGLVLGTGDTDVGLKEHMQARLAVVTMEAFDFRTRSLRWREWLDSMACVVFDEAHLLGDSSRGGVMEAALMRFSQQNPKSRLVLLSATMSNALQIAKWVKSLNGKPTKCVTSSWRPSTIKTSVLGVNGTEKKIQEAVRLVSDKMGKKVVVFVHSKATGAAIVKQLRALGIRSAFHNASLAASRRKRLEDTFNDGDSGLNVLVSTSTLSAGVNIG